MSGKRLKYPPEFREQAARLVIETGRPVAQVAAEIGVGEQALFAAASFALLFSFTGRVLMPVKAW